MNRNQKATDWRWKASAALLAGSLSASSLGVLLGAATGLIPSSVRFGLGTIASVALLVPAFVPRLAVPQRDVETAQKLLHAGPLRWSLANGALLGAAVTSRIGFWLWYVVPLAIFILGSWRLGGLLYGAYGLARMGAIVVMAWEIRSTRSKAVCSVALGGRSRARQVCRVTLLVTAAFLALVTGL